jgi:hypothetical protein
MRQLDSHRRWDCITPNGIRWFTSRVGRGAPRRARRQRPLILQRQLADLGVQRLYVDEKVCRRVAAKTEHIGSPALKLAFREVKPSTSAPPSYQKRSTLLGSLCC